jgi:hypothetical protein
MISEKMDECPRPDIEDVMAECQPYTEKFYESDKVLYDAGLESEIKNLLRVDGKVMVTGSTSWFVLFITLRMIRELAYKEIGLT